MLSETSLKTQADKGRQSAQHRSLETSLIPSWQLPPQNLTPENKATNKVTDHVYTFATGYQEPFFFPLVVIDLCGSLRSG